MRDEDPGAVVDGGAGPVIEEVAPVASTEPAARGATDAGMEAAGADAGRTVPAVPLVPSPAVDAVVDASSGAGTRGDVDVDGGSSGVAVDESRVDAAGVNAGDAGAVDAALAPAVAPQSEPPPQSDSSSAGEPRDAKAPVTEAADAGVPARDADAPSATDAARPEAPAEPARPAVPETPAEPEAPSEPEAPTRPEAPSVPQTPAVPETPARPQAPTQPAEPAVRCSELLCALSCYPLRGVGCCLRDGGCGCTWLPAIYCD